MGEPASARAGGGGGDGGIPFHKPGAITSSPLPYSSFQSAANYHKYSVGPVKYEGKDVLGGFSPGARIMGGKNETKQKTVITRRQGGPKKTCSRVRLLTDTKTPIVVKKRHRLTVRTSSSGYL